MLIYPCIVIKVKLQEFLDKQECQDFINKFIKDKRLISTNISQIIFQNRRIYFVFIEYEE